jgi:antitoxin StbD
MPLPTRSATPLDVLPMKEARKSLPRMSRCFREQGAAAEPVFFGSHRKLVGVMLSYERYVQMLDLLDDFAAVLEIRRRDREDTGERMTLEELIEEQGFDPADFGVRS